MEKAPQLKIPMFIFHGEGDRIALAEGVREFHQRVSASNKKLHIYPNLYHEPHNETEAEREQVLSDLSQWIWEQFA